MMESSATFSLPKNRQFLTKFSLHSSWNDYFLNVLLIMITARYYYQKYLLESCFKFNIFTNSLDFFLRDTENLIGFSAADSSTLQSITI